MCFVIVEEITKKNGECDYTLIASYHITELMTREEWDKLFDDKIQNEIYRLRSITQKSQKGQDRAFNKLIENNSAALTELADS